MSSIKELANKIHALQKEAVKQTLALYKPEIEYVLNNKVQDSNTIERILDALLDVAFDDEILILYKKLCSYYYNTDKEGTAFYVNYYREMWDNQEEKEN